MENELELRVGDISNQLHEKISEIKDLKAEIQELKECSDEANTMNSRDRALREQEIRQWKKLLAEEILKNDW